jgi:hypothetical protein
MARTENEPGGRRGHDRSDDDEASGFDRPDEDEAGGFDRADDEPGGFDQAFGAGTEGIEGGAAAALVKHAFGAGEVNTEAKAVDGASEIGADDTDSPPLRSLDDGSDDGSGMLGLLDDLVDDAPPGGLAPASERADELDDDLDDPDDGFDEGAFD